MSRPSPMQLRAAIAVIQADKKAKRAERGPRVIRARVENKGRELDPAYISWLHDWDCIACLIVGRSPADQSNIEAAHQKAQDASRGWNKLLGRRVHDRQACPLCAYHHRTGGFCCDPAQGKFWALLAVDVIDFCEALYAAFRAGSDGNAVVRAFATRANPDRNAKVMGPLGGIHEGKLRARS